MYVTEFTKYYNISNAVSSRGVGQNHPALKTTKRAIIWNQDVFTIWGMNAPDGVFVRIV